MKVLADSVYERCGADGSGKDIPVSDIQVHGMYTEEDMFEAYEASYQDSHLDQTPTPVEWLEQYKSEKQSKTNKI